MSYHILLLTLGVRVKQLSVRFSTLDIALKYWRFRSDSQCQGSSVLPLGYLRGKRI